MLFNKQSFFLVACSKTISLNGWLTSIILAVIMLITLPFRKSIADLMLSLACIAIRRRDPEYYKKVKETLREPLSYLVSSGLLMAACHLMPPFSDKWQAFIIRVVQSVFTAVIFWFVYQLIFLLVVRYKAKKGAPLGVSAMTFLTSMLRASIVVLGFFVILSFWVSNLTGIIAGLGVGGLALSLAAQDTIGNFLGSVSILIDGTFSVGDFIETVDFSGTVEEIGVRTSKVRDFNGARVSVPNKILAQSIVTNATERKTRRIEVRVTVPPFVSIDTLVTFQDRLREMLASESDIQEPVVLMEGMSAEGRVIYLTCFASPDFSEMRQKRSDICHNLSSIAEEMSIPLFSPKMMMTADSKWMPSDHLTDDATKSFEEISGVSESEQDYLIEES
ncbi:MAG: mechanosensitive ion channel family protein [Saccharofermentanales bacterium]